MKHFCLLLFYTKRRNNIKKPFLSFLASNETFIFVYPSCSLSFPLCRVINILFPFIITRSNVFRGKSLLLVTICSVSVVRFASTWNNCVMRDAKRHSCFVWTDKFELTCKVDARRRFLTIRSVLCSRLMFDFFMNLSAPSTSFCVRGKCLCRQLYLCGES